MTLHESASAAQARWAAGYIRQHCRRRRFAWILAVALAGCVGFGIFCVVGGVWWNALLVSLFFTLVPLICIQYAAEYSIDGFPAAAEWLTAWVIFLLDGAVLLGHYHDSGRLVYGVAQASCAAGVLLLLAFGLRIPPDPSIDWDGVLADFLIRARTARSGKACPYRISNYAQAEEMAAAWLRRFGYRDAAVSGKSSSGNDGGIDVYGGCCGSSKVLADHAGRATGSAAARWLLGTRAGTVLLRSIRVYREGGDMGGFLRSQSRAIYHRSGREPDSSQLLGEEGALVCSFPYAVRAP